eukprot:m.229866 g.229866  ORF g.229866 m.229866 type:complete len:1306 (-) comp15993_c0_seq1:6139-10056(-)
MEFDQTMDQAADEELSEKFPHFYYGKTLKHTMVFNTYSSGKRKRIHVDNIEVTRNVQNLTIENAPDEFEVFSDLEVPVYEIVPHRQQPRKEEPKKRRSSLENAEQKLEQKPERRYSTQPTLNPDSEQSLQIFGPARFFLASQDEWEQRIVWESSAKPKSIKEMKDKDVLVSIADKAIEKAEASLSAQQQANKSSNDIEVASTNSGATNTTTANTAVDEEKKNSTLENENYVSLFPPGNEQINSGSWVSEIMWDVPSTSSKRAKPLILDLNDNKMLFDTAVEKPAMKLDRHQHADEKRLAKWKKKEYLEAARLRAAEAAKRPLPPPNASNDFFNISSDGYYRSKEGMATSNLSLKKSLGKPVVGLKHARPAVELSDQYYPTTLKESALTNFHRPKLSTFKNKTGLKTVQVAPQIDEAKENKLRRAGAVWKDRDLTAVEGKIVLAEFCEQHPPLLQRPGMCTLMRNYYRKEHTSKLPNCEHGVTVIVGFRDASPFLGNLKPGQLLQSFENNMYRAPTYKHKVNSTDFLIIIKKPHAREKGGKKGSRTLYIKKIPHIYTVGQQCPKIDVPAPSSKKVSNFISDRVKLFICRSFKQNYEKNGGYDGKGLSLEELKDAFKMPPNHLKDLLPVCSETTFRKKLREVGEWNQKGDWSWKKDLPMPSEQELIDMVSPEQVCAYESMQAGLVRLKQMGYRKGELNEDYDAEKEDEEEKRDNIAVFDELRMAPWRVTADFIAHLQGKCLMYITGPAEPTGAGEGFAYLRKPNKPAVTNDATAKRLKPQEGISSQKKEGVAHSDKDLRKLTVQAASAMLVNRYGMKEADFKGLPRWRIISIVREKATEEAGEDGTHRFARGQRSTIEEYVNQFKQDCQRIFDTQNNTLILTDLTSDEEEESEEDDVASRYGHQLESALRNDTSALASGGSRRLSIKKKKRVKVDEEASTLISTGTSAIHPKRKLVISRKIFKDGQEYTRDEIVRDPEVIKAYVREFKKRKDKGGGVITKNRERRKRHIEQQLEMIRKEEAKEREIEASDKNSPSFHGKNKKIKCGRCGQRGHMQTNKMCPLYNKNTTAGELHEVETKYEEMLSGNLADIEGTKLNIKIGKLQEAQQVKEEKHRVIKARRNVGQRNAKKKYVDSDDEETLLWEKESVGSMNAISRTRTRNPEVTLNSILNDIMVEVKGVEQSYFLNPVSTKLCPDYYNFVKRPMTISDIQLKIREQHYRSRHEFVQDFRLIASNAMLYNGTEHPIYKAADVLRNAILRQVQRRSAELDIAERALETYQEPTSDEMTEFERDTKARALAIAELKNAAV